MRCFIEGDKTRSDKEKKKLSRRWGDVPAELQIGFLVNRFSQTPYQLGFTDEPDITLLYRAMEAAHAYSLAEKVANQKASDLSIEEGLMVGKILKAIDQKKISVSKLNRPM